MGNEPSIATLPESWHVVLPNITRETILQYSYRHRHRRSTRSSSGVGSSSSSSSNGNINVDGNDKEPGEDTTDDRNTNGQQKSVDQEEEEDDDIFDLDEHVPTALAILTAYPHLKDIRFKLVPGVLKEERYWECIFGILNDHDHGNGGDDNKDEGRLDNITDTQVDYGNDLEEDITSFPPIETSSPTGKPKPLGKVGKKLLVESPISNLERAYYYNEPLASNATTTNTPPFYLDEIKAQHERIQQLEKNLREARHQARKLALELHKERRREGGQADKLNEPISDETMKPCPRCSNSTFVPETSSTHKGQWVMHPDCMEFMKLDDHLKENLRSEKQKRINEVLAQMKFILDTDEMKDSYGRWSCCGSEEYMAKGCCALKK